ncbi:MAG: sulfotransferase [Cyanobium sp. NAT70]|nr:sulfotransferase [Cyanobium sp. NAT70]|tara:strand:- start:2191 stop:3024 length:834 start_codon:yes stop_codon:yes gene_type:complete
MPIIRELVLNKLLQDSLEGKHDHIVEPFRHYLPNFIVIGAAKSATTSLAAVFRRHDQIQFSSAKEPKFFGRNYERGWSWYADFFKKGEHLPLRGEATTMYSSSSGSFRLTPQLINHHLGCIKLIYLIRHPMERLVSQWRHYKGRHPDCSDFNQILDCKDLRKRIVETSLYYEQLQRYLAVFPAESIHCMLTEELIESPRQTLKQMFRFLGTPPRLQTVLRRGKLPAHNKAGSKGRNLVPKPEWPKPLKERVLALIQPDAERMLRSMNRPLSTWDWTL